LTPEQEEQAVSLNKDGVSNRKIALQFGVSRNTVRETLSKHGLRSSSRIRHRLDIIDAERARCWKCKEVKPVGDFKLVARPGNDPYRESVCRGCREKESTLRMASDFRKYLKARWGRLRKSSEKNKVLFSINPEDLYRQYEEQDGRCFYTDYPLSLEPNAALTLSVDRVVPEGGYVKGNVVLCGKRVNTIKNDVTLEEMMTWMPDWYARAEKFKRVL
jgi:lambda repressor-like predicted transcriptional regulator